MFDSFYEFINIGKTQSDPFVKDNGLLNRLHYKFKTETNTYIIDVLCYKNSLYIIEFFLRKDKNNRKYSRYGKLTNEKKATQIVRTCFEVMLLILKTDMKASFAFIGSPTYQSNKQVELMDSTKRFKIYRYVSINLLGAQSFEQFGDENTSCYLIANNRIDKLLIKKQASNILKSLF